MHELELWSRIVALREAEEKKSSEPEVQVKRGRGRPRKERPKFITPREKFELEQAQERERERQERKGKWKDTLGKAIKPAVATGAVMGALWLASQAKKANDDRTKSKGADAKLSAFEDSLEQERLAKSWLAKRDLVNAYGPLVMGEENARFIGDVLGAKGGLHGVRSYWGRSAAQTGGDMHKAVLGALRMWEQWFQGKDYMYYDNGIRAQDIRAELRALANKERPTWDEVNAQIMAMRDYRRAYLDQQFKTQRNPMMGYGGRGRFQLLGASNPFAEALSQPDQFPSSPPWGGTLLGLVQLREAGEHSRVRARQADRALENIQVNLNRVNDARKKAEKALPNLGLTASGQGIRDYVDMAGQFGAMAPLVSRILGMFRWLIKFYGAPETEFERRVARAIDKAENMLADVEGYDREDLLELTQIVEELRRAPDDDGALYDLENFVSRIKRVKPGRPKMRKIL